MRKRIHENEASKLFLKITFEIIGEHWNNGMANDLQKALGIDKNLQNDNLSVFHFSNAFIALQMNTLFHVLPNEHAIRIRNSTYKNLKILWHDDKDPYLAETALNTVDKFEQIIKFFPTYPNGFPINTFYEIPPLKNISEAIGIALSDLFDIDLIIKINDLVTYDLFTTTILGDTLVLFSNIWNWKKFLDKFKILT